MAVIAASRSELLEWINTYFDVNYTKIEQCGNGEVYCKIFNALFPNTININRIQKNPKSEYNILINYKLLQNGFNKCKISRDVNVEKLLKCRLQDNLEFLQWFGKLWCEHNPDFIFSSGEGSRPPSRRASSINNSSNSMEKRKSSTSAKSNATTRSTSRISSNSIQPPQRVSHSNDELIIAQLKQEKQDLENQLDKEISISNGIEMERNFYFKKLREIEFLCTSIQENNDQKDISLDTFIEGLTKILYSTEDGFVVMDQTQLLHLQELQEQKKKTNNILDDINSNVDGLEIEDHRGDIVDNKENSPNQRYILSKDLLDDETF